MEKLKKHFHKENSMTAEKNMKTGWKFVILVGLFSFAGLILCWYMLAAHSSGGGLLANKWFCGGEGAFSYGCTGVFASRYGKFMGFPLPELGAMYFGVVFLWILVFGRNSFNLIFAGLLATGLLVSAFLLYILFFVLPGQCRWCLLTHIINGLLIATSIGGFYKSRLKTGLADILALRGKILLVAFIFLSVAGWSSAYMNRFYAKTYINNYIQLRQNKSYQHWLYESQTPRKMSLTKDEHLIGSRTAPVKIIIYKDFQCSACKEAWTVIKNIFDKIYRENPKSICLAIRHFPQSSQCNKYWKTDPHPFACSAARAVETVSGLIGEEGFWEYNQLLIDNADELDKLPYLRLAEKLGIPKDTFIKAFRDKSNSAKVKRDIESAKKFSISAVPAIFLNGRYIDISWRIPGLLEQMIKSEMQTK